MTKIVAQSACSHMRQADSGTAEARARRTQRVLQTKGGKGIEGSARVSGLPQRAPFVSVQQVRMLFLVFFHIVVFPCSG
jgi:hypothetical protein